VKPVKYVFVVLAFRTGRDIPAFVQSVASKFDSYRIVVVNSFFSQQSLEEIAEIAKENDCDFIPIENKGYGYGNNVGIKYAQEHYDYEYLIVANADIEIQKADLSCLDPDVVNAPLIRTMTGKKQNPYWACRNKLGEWLIFRGFKNHSRLCLIMGQGMNKVIRELMMFCFLHSKRQRSRVYAAHGSFLIFPKTILERISPVFDENMFLYYEEAFLARKLRQMGIGIVLQKGISILHFEDGSTKGSNLDLSPYARESFLYYYSTGSRSRSLR